MSFILKVMVLNLLFNFCAQITIASPESRCRIKHCLCKVRGDVGQNPEPSVNSFKDIKTQENKNKDLKNKSANKKLTVYFEYDKHHLNGNDKVDIYKYIRANSFAGGFYLDGHASSDGNKAYNQRLSQKRIASVSKKVTSIIRSQLE